METIARLLGARVGDFEGYRAPPPLAPAPVFQRATELEALSAPASLAEPAEQDEIDVAFQAGR